MNDKSSNLIIIGAGGHAVSVANVALSHGYNILCFVDENKNGQKVFDLPVVTDFLKINLSENYGVAIAIGDNFIREKVYKELVSKYDSLKFPSLIHETAVISTHARLGEGCVVMPNAVVGPNSKIGRFCLINTMSSVDHDCVMEDFSSIAPGVATGGNVKIGERSAISIGAVIKHGVVVGNDSIIGANSYVNTNITSNVVAYGSPAKIVRERSIDEPYLK